MSDVFKIKVSPRVLEEWGQCERGSWEDHHEPKEGHVYNILGRHKTVIEVRSPAEAALLIQSADFQGDTCGMADKDIIPTHTAIGRIGRKLEEHYGFYYSYPHFKSKKTGEVIPNPIEQPEAKMTLEEIESTYSRKEVEEAAREKGVSTAGSKRDIIKRLL